MTSKLMRTTVLVLVSWLSTVSVAAAGDAEKAFERGQQLVAAGQLRAAAEAVRDAVMRDLNNQTYRQHFMATRQALKYQMIIDAGQTSAHWDEAADGLSLYYRSRGHHEQALPIDQAIYEKRESADAGIQLAETLLALEQSERAAEVLEEVASRQATPASRALLCVALARQGDAPSAQRMAATLHAASNADPYTLYLVARAQAAVGEDAQAMETLTRCYESVPPSRLGALKSHTKSSPEFGQLVSSDAFSRVLETESKVPESKCSGGSSCGSCPMRGKCSRGGH